MGYISEEVESFLEISESVARIDTENILNRAIYQEEALSRVLSYGKAGFMILSANLDGKTVEENYRNTRALKKRIKKYGFQFFEIISKGEDGVNEISLFVPFTGYSIKECNEIGIGISSDFHQPGFITLNTVRKNIVLLNANPAKKALGTKLMEWEGMNVDSISKAYSFLRNKTFLYEGVTFHNTPRTCLIAKEFGFNMDENDYFIGLAIKQKILNEQEGE